MPRLLTLAALLWGLAGCGGSTPTATATRTAAASGAPTASTSPGSSASAVPTPSPAAGRWPLPIAGLVPPAGFALHVPILMYHRIVDPAQAGDALPGLVVPPALFSRQMAALSAAGWRTVTVAQVFDALQHGRALPPRTVAISFDDGYDDDYANALPILRRYGYVATAYVISGRIRATNPPGTFLTPAHVAALAAAGWEIGDHTVSHLELPALAPAFRHAQVMGAWQRIEALTGERPATFAYPAGRFDAASIAELARDGFGLALTTAGGALETWANRLAAPRVRVTPSTLPSQLLAALRALEPGS